MKKVILLLLIAIETFAQTGNTIEEKQTNLKDSLFAIAYYAAEDGDYNFAIIHYSKALAISPTDLYSFCNRGYCFYQIGEFKRAIEDYTKALYYEPNYFIYNNRGLSYQGILEYESALKDFERSLALNDEFFSAYYNKGRMLNKLGEKEQAIIFHNKAITLVDSKVNEAEILTSKADIYFSIEDYDNTIKTLEKIIEIGEAYSYTYARIGDVHRRKKEVQKAIDAYDKAISYETVYSLAYLYRGKMKMHGEFKVLEESKNDLLKYIELEPEDPEGYNSFGAIVAYQKQADYCKYWKLSCEKGDCTLYEQFCKK
jgi:tetratricopeptide (TPR) repeat protein